MIEMQNSASQNHHFYSFPKWIKKMILWCKAVLSANVSRAYSGEPISEDQLYHSTAALLQTATSITNVTQTFLVGALFERTLLFRWAWAVTEQNDKTEYWTVMTPEGEGKPGHCWAVRRGIYFRLPKIQCIPSKWTQLFLSNVSLFLPRD